MRVLIAGGAGYLGGALTDILLKNKQSEIEYNIINTIYEN